MALSKLDRLYKSVVMDHYETPRYKGHLGQPSIRVELYNPSCGDVLALEIAITDGKISGVAFEGEGCAISMASASMMCQQINGLTLKKASSLQSQFSRMLTVEDEKEAQALANEDLGDAALLIGIRKFPARVKCASLAWQALYNALDKVELEKI